MRLFSVLSPAIKAKAARSVFGEAFVWVIYDDVLSDTIISKMFGCGGKGGFEPERIRRLIALGTQSVQRGERQPTRA